MKNGTGSMLDYFSSKSNISVAILRLVNVKDLSVVELTIPILVTHSCYRLVRLCVFIDVSEFDFTLQDVSHICLSGNCGRKNSMST